MGGKVCNRSSQSWTLVTIYNCNPLHCWSFNNACPRFIYLCNKAKRFMELQGILCADKYHEQRNIWGKNPVNQKLWSSSTLHLGMQTTSIPPFIRYCITSIHSWLVREEAKRSPPSSAWPILSPNRHILANAPQCFSSDVSTAFPTSWTMHLLGSRMRWSPFQITNRFFLPDEKVRLIHGG